MPRDTEYYYLDIDLTTLQIVAHGIDDTATLTGNTDNPNIHRTFLTRGQYNKMVRKLKAKQT